jgi:hypothetical protein
MPTLVPSEGRLVDPYGNPLLYMGQEWTPAMMTRLLADVLAAAGGKVWIPNGFARLLPTPPDIAVAGGKGGRMVELKDFDPGDRKRYRDWLRVMEAWRGGYHVNPEILAGERS